jgi:hypothetical protein
VKAILIINPNSGKAKRKMPPIFKWTFKKIERSLIEVSSPKITNAEILKEVGWGNLAYVTSGIR